jgi:hypothetical protein
MTRGRLTAAVATALAAAGIAAAAGSAQSPPTALHLVSTQQKRVGFVPKHAPRQGDRFGFGQKISGSDTGVSRVLCTDIGGQLVCTMQLQLSHGTLTAQGIVPERANHTPVAITGGTGAYDGARGTALATDVSAKKSVIDITLRP